MQSRKKLKSSPTAAAWRFTHSYSVAMPQRVSDLCPVTALSGSLRNGRAARGIRGNRREVVFQSGGVVQRARTPYSHPEQQDHERDFHSSRGSRRCGNRCEWSADEVVSWLDRIAANRHPPATNKNAKHAMFSGRISGRGMRFVPETNTRMWSGFQDSTIRASRGAKCLCRLNG